MKKINLSEAFYSIQGEGKTTGVPSVFLRLAGCNLLCGGKGTDKDGKLHNGATWRCDSIEVWQKKINSFEPEQLINHLNSQFGFLNVLRKGAHLIITGGEPMLQQEAIFELINHLDEVYNTRPYIEFETNGTIPVIEKLKKGVDRQFNISPKLKNSGESYDRRIIHNDYLVIQNAQFKFVVGSEEDIIEAFFIAKQNRIPTNKIWLMPAASSEVELKNIQGYVAEQCIKMGCNYSNRLHIQIWNKKTGV